MTPHHFSTCPNVDPLTWNGTGWCDDCSEEEALIPAPVIEHDERSGNWRTLQPWVPAGSSFVLYDGPSRTEAKSVRAAALEQPWDERIAARA